MSRAQPLSPDERRAQLVDAARDVFGAKGYHAAGVSDIIDAAGVARGTFYNYFESKRAAFQAVLEELMERVAGVVQPIDVERPIHPQVRDNLLRLVEALLDEGDACRILFTDAAGIDPEGDQALADFYGRAIERIARALRTGQQMGVVHDCDVRLVATMLLGMLKEPVFQALLHGVRLDAPKLVEEMFAFVRKGVLD